MNFTRIKKFTAILLTICTMTTYAGAADIKKPEDDLTGSLASKLTSTDGKTENHNLNDGSSEIENSISNQSDPKQNTVSTNTDSIAPVSPKIEESKETKIATTDFFNVALAGILHDDSAFTKEQAEQIVKALPIWVSETGTMDFPAR